MKKLTVIASALVLVFTAAAQAKVSEQEAAKLGTELTPVGAEVAGNEDGSIPAWDGGITATPAGYEKGQFHPNPFAADEVLATITSANMAEHSEYLTPGVKAMLEQYPDTFKLKLYPTRRSASYPEFIYDEVKKNAINAELVEGGNGIKGASAGTPFPIPQSGVEAIWNHILRYRGEAASLQRNQAAPTPTGKYTLVETEETIIFVYGDPSISAEEMAEKNMIIYFKQVVTSPSRLAGTALLVHETMDQNKQPRQAWTYNTGQRRVRRAPNVAFDTPGTVSDGLRTTDDFDLYNGSPERYNWELKGKKEIYIPYNDYELHSDKLSYDQILKPGHINMDLVRWEKHRVWEVEATLKDGVRHTYKTRNFYLDEDSWQVALTDMYDNRDELYRVGMAHAINYYEKPLVWSTLETFYDLNSRRYLAMGLDNQGDVVDFDVKLTKKKFTPQALRRSGRR
ncbi:DUF1329 domain-containing protein [Ferrimonas lipolytica]|uniref:DUF1329 domain-containing protein n=1 Tax=Ferrimonas lipolytica TaxID=2724191 RepID=A0A6H1UFJ0_9GAMM|nr:DUF1329 domain-containing protein [Ferrimonas lipolytica]QIZ76562.1 DUF1329 domain-containing protein [Ferrimonas lipolytica]